MNQHLRDGRRGQPRKLWKNSKLHASGGSWGGVDVSTPNWVPSVFMNGAELGGRR